MAPSRSEAAGAVAGFEQVHPVLVETQAVGIAEDGVVDGLDGLIEAGHVRRAGRVFGEFD
jgi:hypothetical protein